MIDLFERMGLNTNEVKTKFMVVRGTQAPTARTQETYNRMARKEKGPSWQKQKVKCQECGKEMLAVSLKRHMATIHKEEQVRYQCRKVEEKGMYVAKVVKGINNRCPVPGCEGGGTDKFSFYQHFAWRHNGATIRIEGDGEMPKCELCGMYSANIPRHQKTKTCLRLRKKRENERLQDLQVEGDDVRIMVYGKEIERVEEFNYLGRILTSDDNDTKAIENQIKKARAKWNSIASILKREGADAKTMATFYRTVIQAVLLYGAESWCVSETNLRKLRAFHHRAVRYMTGRHIRKLGEGRWEYPNHEQLRKKCELLRIEEYIEKRKGNLRTFLMKERKELWEEVKKTRPPARDVKKILWWEQNLVSTEDIGGGIEEEEEEKRHQSGGRVMRGRRNNGKGGANK